jgi:hypothetical protein
MDNNNLDILKEILEALKQDPETVDVRMAKVGATAAECEVDDLMKDVKLDDVMNERGMALLQTMSLHVIEGDRDLSERKAYEFVGNCLKEMQKLKMNYAEGFMAVANLFNHILEYNPVSTPGSFEKRGNK